jgi:recombination protein RecT
MTTAVEPTKAPTLTDMVKNQQAQVALALPSHLKINAERYVRSALTLIKQTPALAKCDPLTIIGGLMTASSLGLELGPLQVAYLVPYGREAQLIIGYRGYIELFYRSGIGKDITAEVICENDDFTFHRATGELSHTWDLRQPRGAAYAYYAVANFKDGGRAFVVMGKEEVEKYRQRSKAKNASAWSNDFDAMAKKTCIRRLEPYLPKSTEVAQAFAFDGSVSRGTVANEVEVEPETWDDAIDAEVVDPETGEIGEAA